MGRKTSLKDVIRQSGERLHKAVGGGRSPGVESPASVNGSRTPEGTATSQTPRLPVLHRDSSVIDDEIEASVMAMAGLSADPQRRVFSEAGARLAPESNGGEKMERTRSADEAAQDETPDMAMLRRVAALPENLHCADCGKPMKASRWATISAYTKSASIRIDKNRPSRHTDGHVSVYSVLWNREWDLSSEG